MSELCDCCGVRSALNWLQCCKECWKDICNRASRHPVPWEAEVVPEERFLGISGTDDLLPVGGGE